MGGGSAFMLDTIYYGIYINDNPTVAGTPRKGND